MGRGGGVGGRYFAGEGNEVVFAEGEDLDVADDNYHTHTYQRKLKSGDSGV